jgi:hypothetical protein
MAKKRKRGTVSSSGSGWDILRSGKRPTGLSEILSAMHSAGNSGTRAQGIGEQMAQKWNAAGGTPDAIPSDPRSLKAQDALLALHGKFAKQKLLPPSVSLDTGGITGGRISVKVVPPFDFTVVIADPGIQGGFEAVPGTVSASKNGQITCSTLTSRNKSAGKAYAQVGILFHPISDGILRASAAPTSSFQWSTNSLGSSEVSSQGTVALEIFALEPQTTQPGDFLNVGSVAAIGKNWRERETGQIRFDFGSNVQSALSTQMNVSRHLLYVVFVSVNCNVTNVGWPGSLASSAMSVTVPSITWDFEPGLVVSQAD